jgi:ATP-binding cassette, subfamily B, bacterial
MPTQPNKNDQQSLIFKLKEGLRQFPHYLRTLGLIWDAGHGLTLAWAALLIILGVLPVASIYLTKLVVDSFVNTVNLGFSWENIRPLIIEIALMAIIFILTELFQSLLEWIRAAQSEYIQDYITALIHNKSIEVDLRFYETPEYYDHLQRAQSDASTRSLALLENTGSILQNSITLIGIAALLIQYSVWLLVFLIVAALPTLYVALRFNQQYHDWWKETTADRRWTQYYNSLLTSNYVAAEIRLYDLGPNFKEIYQNLRIRLRGERLDLIKRQSLARLVAGMFALLISGLAVIWIGWRTIQGLFNLGDLALFYQSYNRGQYIFSALLSSLGQIYANSLFLGDLFEFLGLEKTIADPSEPVSPPSVIAKGVEFRQVTFTYPGSNRNVFQDFDINFPAGHITAIVGENGAGKSTLVKLICRLYDPQGGRIEIDGEDIRRFPVSEMRRLISVLFQLPFTYYATASQNIAIGDLSFLANETEITNAAINAGAHEVISRLPNGYDTILGKLFAGGSELSVGEWQRVALARSFLRRAQIIVLDEPTSFMDSWAEASWMENFHSLVQGRTAIVITHRFTTAKHADIIHVMREGKIVESGSHQELIALDGYYAKSWENQVNGIYASPSLD